MRVWPALDQTLLTNVDCNDTFRSRLASRYEIHATGPTTNIRNRLVVGVDPVNDCADLLLTTWREEPLAPQNFQAINEIGGLVCY